VTAPSAVLSDALRDRYTLLRELGRGGMATVFLARDLKHDRLVAIKVPRSELAAALGPERFLREIRLAARLQHPHILGLIDSGTFEYQPGLSGPYYVMPYVEGESLRDRLLREGQLPLDDSLRIVREVALALDYAHRHGVIHRDIKPENILLSDSQALIADFGVARALEAAGGERLTETGIAVGTPSYLSPEQAAGGREVDGRADIYSLGCVLYEMLAGEPPFTGPTPQAIIAKRFSEPVPHLRTVRDVPEAIEQAVTKALARSPADRFTTAAQFASALEAHVGDQVLQTRPTAVGARGRRWQWIGLGVATGLAALGAVLWRSRGPPGPALDANLLAVVPFDVVDPSLRLWREGLVDLLSRSLDGAGALRTVSPATFIRHWNGRADPVSARALGRRSGAGLVVFGTVLRGGRDSVRLRAALLDVGSDTPVAEVEVQGDTSRMDRLTDSLAVALLRGLGRTRPVGAVRNSPLGASSLPALKAYLQGEQLYRRGMWDSALVSYDRAIALDSTFALAHRRMAVILWWDPETSKDYKPPNDYALRAAALNRGLAPRDSLLITANSLMATVDPAEDSAFFPHYHQLSATLEEARRRYPGDPEVWYLLGEFRYHSGLGNSSLTTAAEVMKLFDRAIELDSTFGPTYEHTVQLAVAVGGPDLARRYARMYLELGSTDALAAKVRLERMLLDPRQTHSAEVAALLDTMTAVPLWNAMLDLYRWPDSAETAVRLARSLTRGQRSFRGAPFFVADSLIRQRLLAVMLGYRGHLREGYRVGTLTRATGEGWLIPFIDFVIVGMVPVDTVAVVFKRFLEHSLRRDEFWPPVFGHGRALPWWSATHDTVSLTRFAQRADSAARVGGSLVARSYAGYLADAARAYLALARADSATALKSLAALPDTMCVVNDCFFEKLTEARLNAARGEDREAGKILDQWLQVRDRSPLFVLGTLERGRIAERLRDPQAAVRSYQFVASVWRHADAELQPYAAEARAGIARLRREGER
jgi:tetratricopeptide (TPR) repeat protein